MNKIFLDDAWEHYNFWVTEDKKTAKKIFDLITDIERNGANKGKGHPERLKYRPAWSRRIDHANRLVYEIKDDSLYIIACKGHYED